MMKLSRRHLLRGGAALAGAGFLPRLGYDAAHAADTNGYRALVCVFFKGGMDGHDVLLPYDQPSYDRYREIRGPLMDSYGRNEAGARRTRNELLELSPTNASDFGSRRFALPPEMAGLHDLFTDGKAAIVANTGPLLESLDRTAYRERTGMRPPRLFSHNDQQSTWMALAPEGRRFGWGGMFADAHIAANANDVSAFTAISVAGNDVFLSGENVSQYQVSGKGANTVRELTQSKLLGSGHRSETAQRLLDEHFRGAGMTRSNLFERDMNTISRRSIEINTLFNDSTVNAPPLLTEFPDTRLGGQLQSIAQTIDSRTVLGAKRQIFFAAIGGFDTHSGQASSLPGRQREISEAIASFYAATEEMGIAQDVTLFTASDFGRTLAVNGDGSDHGWGGHQFVVGGGVNGGRIYGDVPPAELDHQWDSGRGRLIPTTSIEQFAAPMGRWFGLNESEISGTLPLLNRFGPVPTFI
ncbi:MAG: DUF1501 domain-containing protein [Pseudomonadota bacterium]